ncbi:hypothetical protein [Streptomyces alfalfae]
MSSTEGGVRKWLWSTARAVSHSQVSRCAISLAEATPGGRQQQDTVGDLRIFRVGGGLRRGAGGSAGALVGGLDGTLQREVLVLAGLRLRPVLGVLHGFPLGVVVG